jgi:hypothetical protein
MPLTTMFRRAAALALVGAGLGAGAAGAQSPPAPASIPVADGRIEHVVARVVVSGTRAVPSDVTIERWHSADTAHGVRVDRRTGALETEHVHGPGGTFIFDAKANTLRVDLRAQGPAPESLAQEGEDLRRQVAAGAYAVAGETEVAGRPAFVLQSVPGVYRSDEPASSTRIVADKETYIPYERTTGLPDGRFTQTVRIVKAEQLPLAGNARLLRMGRHDGARKVVVGKARAGKAGEPAVRR